MLTFGIVREKLELTKAENEYLLSIEWNPERKERLLAYRKKLDELERQLNALETLDKLTRGTV